MPSSEALNIEVIVAAINQHDEKCKYPLICIFMAPFEVERLGWDDVKGIPIEEDEEMQTGRFRLYCDAQNQPDEEDVEAVAEDRLVTV